MFNPLKGLGDMGNMLKYGQALRSAVLKEEIVVEKDGVRVVLRGDQQVKEVVIDGILDNRVADAINEAVRKTQELAASHMKEIMDKG